jgi:pimeloyl-ACP methyl ester carboxylesterase
MGRTPVSMMPLARALRRAGHETELVGYVPGVESFPRIRSRVRQRLLQLAVAGHPYAAIGHSLGGILLRAALAGWPEGTPRPEHLILLGSPSRPPRLARRFHRQIPYRWINGQSGQLLARSTFFSALPTDVVQCTVIAGTRGWERMGMLFDGVPNDGIVAVDEAEPAPGGRADLRTFHVNHTFMMNNRRVRELILELLGRPAGRP